MASVTIRLCEHSDRGRAVTDLPTFYMNDWSELALRVSALAAARQQLRELGKRITGTGAEVRLHLESRGELPGIVAHLVAGGLKADLSDTVTGLYQG